jgi:hypothetical protein
MSITESLRVTTAESQRGCVECGTINSFKHRIPERFEEAVEDFGECVVCGRLYSILTSWQGEVPSARIEPISHFNSSDRLRKDESVWPGERVIQDDT